MKYVFNYWHGRPLRAHRTVCGDYLRDQAASRKDDSILFGWPLTSARPDLIHTSPHISATAFDHR